MKNKIWLAMIMICGLGLSSSYTACINSVTAQQNFSVLVNGNETNISITTDCQYGCDQAIGKCNTIDAGYGMITTISIIVFIVVMFWISHFLKRKETEEEDVPKATMSLVFMLLGMTGLLGLLVYVGGLVTGYDSGFLQVGAGMMSSFSNIWAIVLTVFPMIIVVFYLIRLVRDRLIDKRR